MFDLVIKNGTLIDGTEAASYKADIGINGTKIAQIGVISPSDAIYTIDASNMIVTPGFIDIHRHADAALFRKGFGEAELAQGLTTIINGNCGLGIAPFGDGHRDAIMRYLQPVLGDFCKNIETRSIGGYLSSIPALPINIGMLAGAGTIRTDLIGYDACELAPEQIRRVSSAIENALSEGAFGVSLGLGYAPECFYTTEQLTAVLAPLRNGNVPITVHMRQEGDGVTVSVKEMLKIAQELNCPVHISHLKSMGRRNWNRKIPEILSMIDRANASGLQVDFDVYPYTAGSTQLMIIMPPEFLAGGPDELCRRLSDPESRKVLYERLLTGTDFDNIVQLAGWDGIYVTSVGSETNRKYCGKSLTEIAEARGCTPFAAACDLLIEERGQVTMIDFMADVSDIDAILKHPKSNVISDATYPSSGLPHPRVYGTFSRIIERFVLERKVLSLEDAIRKMTSIPADVLGLKSKGYLSEGMDADICIFDPAKIKENADYTTPNRCSSGMHKVLVNGSVAYENGKRNEILSGKVLKR